MLIAPPPQTTFSLFQGIWVRSVDEMANHIRLVGLAGWQCAGLVGLAWLAGLAPACLVGLARLVGAGQAVWKVGSRVGSGVGSTCWKSLKEPPDVVKAW